MSYIIKFRDLIPKKYSISCPILIKLIIVFLSIVSAGCATRGPLVLENCLKDNEIMDSYLEFQNSNHENFLVGGRSYLTGGFHEHTNTVNCYWQAHNLANDMFSPNSNPISRCYNQGNDKCAILMDGPKNVFNPSGKESSQTQDVYSVNSVGSPPEKIKRADNTVNRDIDQTQQPSIVRSESVGNAVKVIFHLLGAFAEGYANGLAQKNASVLQNTTTNNNQVKKVSESLRNEQPLRCSRDLVPGPTGYGYTCMRGF